MFRFKQFTIRQERTAMKVCTDACVLGAYAEPGLGGSILDIGTGTGLLALMAAQRNPTAMIDAVELDDVAADQATANVADSPFSDRVQVVHQRIQDFNPTRNYDHILTNPPFYTDQLRSPDARVNRALHTDDLPFTDLIDAVGRLLKPDGNWWVLLPPYETEKLIQMAHQRNLSPFRQLHLRHQASRPVFRVVTGLGFWVEPIQADSVIHENLDIFEGDGKTYTPAFRALLRDFYLIF